MTSPDDVERLPTTPVEDEILESIFQGRLVELPAYGVDPITYVAPEYTERPVVPALHDAPRYGEPRDVATFFHGTRSERREYANGVRANFVLLWCVFLIWSLVLVLCKKNKKLGWLAGVPPKRPVRPSAGKSSDAEKKDVDDGKGEEEEEEIRVASASTTKTTTGPPEGTLDPREEEEAVRSSADDGDEREAARASVDGDGGAVAAAVPVAPSECAANDDDDDPGKVAGKAPSDDFEDNGASDDDDESRDEALAKWYGDVRRVERKVRRCRIATLFFGVTTIALSVVLIQTGFDSLDMVIKTAQATLPELIDIVDEANNATHKYLIEVNATKDARQKLLTDIAEFCHVDPELYDSTNPVFREEEWWRRDDNWPPKRFLPSYISFDFENATIEEAAIFLNETLNNVTIVYVAMENVNDTLYNISGLLDSIDGVVGAVDEFWFYLAVGFIIALDVMVLLFMAGVILAWRERQRRLFRDAKTRCVLPLFLVILFVSYLICTYCLVFSTGMSDFCINTPDDQVLRIIDAQFPFTDYADWYIRGCHVEDEPRLWFAVFDAAAVLLKLLNDFLMYLTTVDTSELVDLCDRESNFLPGGVSVLQQHVEDVIVLTIRIKKLLECTNVNPIYTDLAYETVCHYGITATAEISFYLFVMAICCMGIVTLRVAWYEIEDDEDGKGGRRLLYRNKPEKEREVVGKGTEPAAADVGDGGGEDSGTLSSLPLDTFNDETSHSRATEDDGLKTSILNKGGVSIGSSPSDPRTVRTDDVSYTS